MSTMDDFVNGAKHCVDVVAVKTGEFVENSRVRIEKASLNSKLKEQYVELGKLTYNMSIDKEDLSERMKSCIIKINKILEEISFADKNLGVKPAKICPQCGFRSHPQYVFCSKCGSKLEV